MRREGNVKSSFTIALVLACCLAARTQTPANATGSSQANPAQNSPTQNSQNPALTKPQTTPQPDANAFPTDTTSIPVLPSNSTPAVRDPSSSGFDDAPSLQRIPLPTVDTDPARSPDDPTGTSDGAEDTGSSSSLAGMDRLPKPDDEEPGKKKRLSVDGPAHPETAKEDVNVGSYYLDIKNWKAALSRFQSAMVLDPENPEVYWGLAETERHLGNFAGARAHYQQVLDYDPDGPHGKQARKALKNPEIANAQKPSSAPPAATPTQ
jgi:tetratricopeptide (TPR) repeat protein